MKESLTHFFGHYRVQTSFFQLGAYVVDVGEGMEKGGLLFESSPFSRKSALIFRKSCPLLIRANGVRREIRRERYKTPYILISYSIKS